MSKDNKNTDGLHRILNGGKISRQKAARHFARQDSGWHPKVLIKTFGCQMNEHDSERVKDLLLEDGYSLTTRPEDADVVLFNTCSVRKHAEDRVWSEIGRIAKFKKKEVFAPPSFANAKLSRGDTRLKKKIIGLVGCMAEAQGDEIFRKLPYVDFLCGPADLDRVPEIMERVINGGGRIMCLAGYISKKIPEFSKDRRVGKHAYVKIMEGCSNFCSYCIVPYVRGRERSMPSNKIFAEIEDLLAKGVKKITLLGQNVNSYGKGLEEKIDFPELLRKIDRMIERTYCNCRGGLNLPYSVDKLEIDFITSHPKDAGIELFRVMADSGFISKKLHLPLQSGSNKILKRMNRNYTIERYKKLVSDFRRIVKEGAIMTDVIVGFPGETKKDFDDTLKAVKEIGFDSAYIFKYSPRPWTKANEFEDDVSIDEKKSRHKILLETQKQISFKLKSQK